MRLVFNVVVGALMLAAGTSNAAPAAAAANPPAAPVAAAASPLVVFETTKGKITVRLFTDKAPISAKNMLDYVDAGFYNGIIFHRVIPGFMIQGGGYTKELNEKPTRAPIKNEATNGLKNLRGTLAMARTPVVDSASAQFFINLADNSFLDNRGTTEDTYGYAVFGEVVDGMDVVDAIAKVERLCPSKPRGPCTASLPPGMNDVPKDAVVIVKAYRKK